MTLTHEQARALIQAAADGLLPFQQRGPLDEHLAGCFECLAYADELTRIEADLRGAMHARLERTVGKRQAARPISNIDQQLQRKHTQKRILAFAQPALWTVGVLILAGAMTWLLGSIRPGTGDQPEGEGTNVSESDLTPSPEEFLSATPDLFAGCIATATADLTVFAQPVEGSAALGALPFEQIVPVTGTIPGTVWVRIMLGDSEGWINSQYAVISGDCAGVEIVKDYPTAPPEIETPSSTLPITLTPIPPPTEVGSSGFCEVAPTDYALTDFQVYGRPADPGTVIGTLGLGEFVPGYALTVGPDGNTWVQVGYQGQTAWVNAVYYQLKDACMGMPQLTPEGIFPTPFPTPTYSGTPSPTPTPLPSTPFVPPTYPPPDAGDIEFVMAVPGDVGTVETFTQSLPLAGDSEHIIQILIQGLGSAPDALQGAFRYIITSVTCEGTDLQFFGWGLVGTVADWGCGAPFTQWVNNGFPSIYLELHTTPGSSAAVTYTIAVRVQSSP